MVDKTAIIPVMREKIDKLPVKHSIDLRTYKRNRSVLFIKEPQDKLRIIENGFEQMEFLIPTSKLEKSLKKILKREFPRSNKIRLYQMGNTPPKEYKKL